jgi:biopolymer transport protein ExbD
MLNSARPLSHSQLASVSALAGQSVIRPKQNRGRRMMVASLMLTSLVDAFSILVIFLIMNHSTSQETVNLGQNITLPKAEQSQFIQEGVVVRLENGKFMIEDKEVTLGDLARHLKTLNESVKVARKEGLIIVGDRDMDYESLSPVILAGANAGFTKFKFAVVRK